MLDALSICAIPLAAMQLCLTSREALKAKCSLDCPSPPFHARAMFSIPAAASPVSSVWSLSLEVQLFLGQNVWVLPSACQVQGSSMQEQASSLEVPQHVQQLLQAVRQGLQGFSRIDGADGSVQSHSHFLGGHQSGAVWVAWRQLPPVLDTVLAAVLALQTTAPS